MKDKTKKIFNNANEMLEEIILKLHNDDNYEENKRLGQILAHYVELYNFKKKFKDIELRLNNTIDLLLKESAS